MNSKPLRVNYDIALPTEAAEIARKRIPRNFATRNKLTIFSVSNQGKVKRLTASDFLK